MKSKKAVVFIGVRADAAEMDHFFYAGCLNRLFVGEGDLRDLSSLIGVLEIAQPDEIYNLGAMSFVGLSFKQPELTGDITGMGVLRMLEAIRIHTQGSMEGVRFYQASSSEMFGSAPPPHDIRSRAAALPKTLTGSLMTCLTTGISLSY